MDTLRTSDSVVTPYLRDWHARKYPNSKWPDIEQRCAHKAPPHEIGTQVVALAARFVHVPVYELLKPGRAHRLAYARMAAMWVLKKRTKYSTTKIGCVLGGRDHSTVVNGLRRVEADLLTGGKRFGPIIAYVETHLGLR